jgi:hypothetical protein
LKFGQENGYPDKRLKGRKGGKRKMNERKDSRKEREEATQSLKRTVDKI